MTTTCSEINYKNNIAFSDLKVLIAEDNEVNQLLAKGILRHWGVETKIATNGNEVLELLKAEDFDLVLMDIQMPVMDGYETTQKIRREHKNSNLPIIAVTAKAMKGDREKCIEAGAWDYLSKPVNTEDLLAVLRAWLPQ